MHYDFQKGNIPTNSQSPGLSLLSLSSAVSAAAPLSEEEEEDEFCRPTPTSPPSSPSHPRDSTNLQKEIRTSDSTSTKNPSGQALQSAGETTKSNINGTSEQTGTT